MTTSTAPTPPTPPAPQFGIAVYPNVRPLKLDPLPPTLRTLTYHESRAGLMEDHNGRLITLNYKKDTEARLGFAPTRAQQSQRRRSTSDSATPDSGTPDSGSMRGQPGRETAGVRRIPTTVPSNVADLVMQRVLEARQRTSRAELARAIGITPRAVHLAELGCVQPAALSPIVGFFGGLSDGDETLMAVDVAQDPNTYTV